MYVNLPICIYLYFSKKGFPENSSSPKVLLKLLLYTMVCNFQFAKKESALGKSGH